MTPVIPLALVSTGWMIDHSTRQRYKPCTYRNRISSKYQRVVTPVQVGMLETNNMVAVWDLRPHIMSIDLIFPEHWWRMLNKLPFCSLDMFWRYLLILVYKFLLSCTLSSFCSSAGSLSFRKLRQLRGWWACRPNLAQCGRRVHLVPVVNCLPQPKQNSYLHWLHVKCMQPPLASE